MKSSAILYFFAFLAGLSSYLGFEPGRKTSNDDIYFDMKNGVFTALPPVLGQYAEPENSEIVVFKLDTRNGQTGCQLYKPRKKDE